MGDLGLDFNHGMLLVGRYSFTLFEVSVKSNKNKVDQIACCLWDTKLGLSNVNFGTSFWFSNKFPNKFSFLVLFIFLSFLRKQVSLSPKAEKVLEETIQENTKGDVIYFWAHLNMDGGVTGSKNALTFWSMCDILNGGYCRYVIHHIWY